MWTSEAAAAAAAAAAGVAWLAGRRSVRRQVLCPSFSTSGRLLALYKALSVPAACLCKNPSSSRSPQQGTLHRPGQLRAPEGRAAAARCPAVNLVCPMSNSSGLDPAEPKLSSHPLIQPFALHHQSSPKGEGRCRRWWGRVGEGRWRVR